MPNLYIYSIFITIIALILVWVLQQTNEVVAKIEDENFELKEDIRLKDNRIRFINDYYERKIEGYEKQINADTDLIDTLRKENWELRNDRW